MALVLSILLCPDATPPGTRGVPGGDFTLGRAEGCDWVLPDPDRLLSRRHCTLEFRDGFWGVRDLSANGTFVNASSVPVGKDQSAPLEDGDRLRLGGYEFEVRMEAAAGLGAGAGTWSTAPHPSSPQPGASQPGASQPGASQPGASQFGTPATGGGSLAPAPFGESPFAPSPFSQPSFSQPPVSQPGSFRPDPHTNDALRDPFAGMSEPFQPAAPIAPVEGFVPVGDERALPPRHGDRPPMMASPAMDFDPFADQKLGEDRFGPTRADHAPSASDAFVPPRANFGASLPSDWHAAPPSPAPPPSAGWKEPDWDALLGDLGPGGAPKPAAPVAPDPLAQPVPSSFAPQGATPFAPNPLQRIPGAPPPADPFAPGQPSADPFPPAGFGTPPAPPMAAPSPPADAFAPAGFGAVTPPPARADDPFTSPAAPSRPTAAAPPADPFAEQPGYTAAAVPPPRPTPASASSGPGDAAGLDAFLRGAGLPPLPPGTDPNAALHAAGLALRASVGGLRALLIARADVKRAFRIEGTMLSRRDNNPVKFSATDEASVAALLTVPNGAAAVEETVADLTLHQVATLAATQAAARALLDRVSPAEVETANPGGGGLLGGKEKALWTAYKGVHAKLIEQFEDDFDSAFGRAFARAYEEAAKAANKRT